MSKDLYESIKIYEQSVTELLDQKKQGPAPHDMVSLVMGRSLRDTKKEPTIKLVDGRQYGFLTLDKKIKSRSINGTQYKCECECGGTVQLTRREIRIRERMRAGCLGFDCPYGPDEVKAWHNPEFSLWLQLSSLLKSDPEEVDNEWGGRAYPDFALVNTDDGFAKLYEDVAPLVGKAQGRWWLHRNNPVLPYSLYNIKLGVEPDFKVLGGEARYVSYNGTLFSVNELAGMFGLPLKDVKRWRRDHTSDKKVMEIIMTEVDS